MKHLLIAVVALLAFSAPCEAQIFDKIKNKVKNRKERKESETIDKGLDKVEDIFKKKDKSEGGSEEGGSSDGGSNDGASTQGGPVVKPGMSEKKEIEVWMKRYDFKPGKDILFYDDFENESLGEIPSKWHYNKGQLEVVQLGNEYNKVITGEMGYTHPNWEEGFTLPEAYTIEFDVYLADPNAAEKGYGSYGYNLYFYDATYRYKLATIDVYHTGVNLHGVVEGKVPGLTKSDVGGTWAHISISVNGNSIKAYYNDYRVFNARIDGDRKPVLFSIWNCCQTTNKPVFFIDNFKVAAGGHSKYNEEIVNGRIVTNNIHFESGSAEIIPRSYAEIKRIADVMVANPEKKFNIEGHTDSVGDDTYNLNLSNQRAQSVMKALVDMGISEDRLTATGFGEAIPVEDNATPEGRAMNRRVEFIVQ